MRNLRPATAPALSNSARLALRAEARDCAEAAFALDDALDAWREGRSDDAAAAAEAACALCAFRLELSAPRRHAGAHAALSALRSAAPRWTRDSGLPAVRFARPDARALRILSEARDSLEERALRLYDANRAPRA